MWSRGWNLTFDDNSLGNCVESSHLFRSPRRTSGRHEERANTQDRPTHPALRVLQEVAIIAGKCCCAEGAPAEGTLSASGIFTGEGLLPAREASSNPILTSSDPHWREMVLRSCACEACCSWGATSFCCGSSRIPFSTLVPTLGQNSWS